MPNLKGKGGKKHRRGKNVSSELKVDLPDEFQYFAYVFSFQTFSFKQG